ncbi:MAG: Nif3-like dinuclear metal center hexameric protein [Anaerolineae bacterium]|jgi:dinuclear metal center YbgI/SA1388 family protein|nr:Nif3-like dinuclear metal center hexameric protein [Anaerolineae bacterium]
MTADAQVSRDELVAYLDDYLAIKEMKDWGENGLQVEGAPKVHRLAFAVDASLAAIQDAVRFRADMLIAHHGLFWGKPLRIVGAHRRRVKTLLDNECSLYASHLPLDRHPEVGNNAQLAALLDLPVVREFGDAFGLPVGVVCEAERALSLDELVAKFAEAVGPPALVLPGGEQPVRRVGIISGGAASEIAAAVAVGCDAYITGETSHSAYHDAAEYGIHVIFGGHYATETVGLKALARRLEDRYGLPWTFAERPTGL